MRVGASLLSACAHDEAAPDKGGGWMSDERAESTESTERQDERCTTHTA